MKKILFLLFIFSYLISSNIKAVPVDSTEAKQVALNFFRHKNPTKTWAKIIKTEVATYKGFITRYTFVFSNNSFVIVSADNSTVPVLAYSDENAYSEKVEPPPTFEYWLQTEYDELIVYNKNSSCHK